MSTSLNIVELVSLDNSRITQVSLYADRAEITRLYTFNVEAGQNQVVIAGLPNALYRESLRVEGRGTATIHDVTISRMPSPANAHKPTSPLLSRLNKDKRRIENSLARCSKTLESVESYIGSLNVQNLEPIKLGDFAAAYDTTAEKLDDKIIELEAKLEILVSEIATETARLRETFTKDTLRLRASIGVFAKSKEQIQIALIYAVHSANWNAGYDMRVDTQAVENPVTLIYKAAITQSTGESWEDVALTLETVTPTFGAHIPTLALWNLSYNTSRSTVVEAKRKARGLGRIEAPKRRRSSRLRDRRDCERYLDFDIELEEDDEEEEEDNFIMGHVESYVSSQGNVSATFRVPGLTTIPCDGEAHNVTIAQLKLDAVMSWVGVPKIDTKVHLKAKITNSSEYTLLGGNASVYVDGSFISESYIGPISPHETFHCALGLDPSLRVTYHPRSKVISQSGSLFYGKTTNHTFSQRITVHNTKSTPVDKGQFKIIDQIPVSEDSQITIKLRNPPLVISPASVHGAWTNEGDVNPPAPVEVSQTVAAQWEGADDTSGDLKALGKDGKLFWLCGVPAQGKVNLNLEWEVSVPFNDQAEISGLY